MAVEHNSIFSIHEGLGESALELMENGGLVSGTSGSCSEICILSSGYSLLPFDLSTDGSSPGQKFAGDNSSLVTLGDAATDNPDMAAAVSIATSAAGAISSTSSGEEIIVFFFRKNDTPNSYVEKNAASVYNALHGKAAETYTYPAVVTESSSDYETAAKVFGNTSLEKVKETLSIWESILEDYV